MWKATPSAPPDEAARSVRSFAKVVTDGEPGENQVLAVSDESSSGDEAPLMRPTGTKVALATGLLAVAFGGFLAVRQIMGQAPTRHMPLLSSGLSPSWDTELIDQMCNGREAGELPIFDDDDEDEGDEDFASHEGEDKSAFSDTYEGTEPRRLKEAVVAVQGIRRFKLKSGATMPYYGSADVQQEEPSAAEFAVFIFHGAVRDAINYFCAGKKIMEKQTKYDIDKTLMVVLKWHYAIDQPEPSDVWWNSSKPWGSWMAGGHSDARSGGTVSSFSIIDEFLVYLADNPHKYPKLKEILLMGHSAGGQTLHRYAFATHLKPPQLSTDEDVKNGLGFRRSLDVRFVIANPSSYLYLDGHRWAYSCGDNHHDFCTPMEYRQFDFEQGRHNWTVDFEYGDEGWRVTEGLGKQGVDYPFLCRTAAWNNWFYGLNWNNINRGFVIPYLRAHPNISEAVRLYPLRDVVYLVGQNDTCTDNEFPYCDAGCWTRSVPTAKCYRNHMDMRCPAMLQGPNRNQRAIHYQRHLLEFYGEKVHNLFVVPNTGHEGGKIVTSDYGLTAIQGTIDELKHLAIDPYSVPLGPNGLGVRVAPPPPLPATPPLPPAPPTLPPVAPPVALPPVPLPVTLPVTPLATPLPGAPAAVAQ